MEWVHRVEWLWSIDRVIMHWHQCLRGHSQCCFPLFDFEEEEKTRLEESVSYSVFALILNLELEFKNLHHVFNNGHFIMLMPNYELTVIVKDWLQRV